ncbi:hypothetical protein DCAR_0415879 [Daucus carota subsp. sativus]|uniref:Uncharacterized protein n=1 Tax=Daucus carota subsp. sativus TaxID=79200 RepID=A0AAF0WXY5_DAUCS|nr:hypothetical protein DCAR_0415879 [Daucus carota subsp. sativus]
MSWLKSAVTRAVTAGGNAVFEVTKAVEARGNAVVHQTGTASEDAKILQGRIAPQSTTRDLKQTVKTLEDVSVSTRGIERVQLLRVWLVALKETIRVFDEFTNSFTKPTVELYVDQDSGGKLMNFYDVFLYSEALEGMTLSMILEAPNEEEVSLLLEIFGLCLIGGREVHEATIKSILNIAHDFSDYEDEVLIRREELLQFAQSAIAGLKVNPDMKRIDSEVSEIQQKLEEMIRLENSISSANKSSQKTELTAEVRPKLKESMAKFKLCSKLETLLLRKKYLNNGDSPEIHAQKVDKLKVLSESLHSSTSKAEERIQEHRMQKEEAVRFRLSKTNETSQLEKDLEADLNSLERRKIELEAELQKVTSSFIVTKARLYNAREEREQFHQASNQILEHFNAKEDELSRSVATYRAEANACNAFIAFMEATWGFNSSYKSQKEKLVSDELKKHEEYFVDLAVLLLSVYKDELGPAFTNIRKLKDSIEGSQIATGVDIGNLEANKGRKHLEEEYLELEEKIITLFDVVESITKHFITRDAQNSTKGDHRIQELWNSLGNIKEQFETMERPMLEIERPETPGKQLPQRSSSAHMRSPRESFGKSPKRGRTLSLKLITAIPDSKSNLGKGERTPEVLSKYRMTLDDDSREGSTADDIDWEFDDLVTPRSFSTTRKSSPLAKSALEYTLSPLTLSPSAKSVSGSLSPGSLSPLAKPASLSALSLAKSESVSSLTKLASVSRLPKSASVSSLTKSASGSRLPKSASVSSLTKSASTSPLPKLASTSEYILSPFIKSSTEQSSATEQTLQFPLKSSIDDVESKDSSN